MLLQHGKWLAVVRVSVISYELVVANVTFIAECSEANNLDLWAQNLS